MVGRILAAKKADPNADTAALEAEIDDIVCDLIKKIFADAELEEASVIRKIRITGPDGKSYLVNHYEIAMGTVPI